MRRGGWLCAIALSVACGGVAGDDTGDDGGDDGGGDGADPADASPSGQSRVEQLIRGDVATRLVLEIDSVDGFAPRDGAQAELIGLFDDLLDKPDGIDAIRDDDGIPSMGADHAWTQAQLRQVGDEVFADDYGAGTIALHIMFVDGHSASDDGSRKVLGLAFGHTRLVMFKQTIEDLCGASLLPPLLRDRLCEGAELAVWTHEVGHLIGLVDNGLAMVEDHADPDHGGHDVDRDCVMYFAYDGNALMDELTARLNGGGVARIPFDPACEADIAAVRDAP